MVGIRFGGSRDEILTLMQRLGVIPPPYQRGKTIRQRHNVFKEIPSRPDLPAGYGGWQAIDSTPQVIKSMENCIKWQSRAQDSDHPTFGCYQ